MATSVAQEHKARAAVLEIGRLRRRRWERMVGRWRRSPVGIVGTVMVATVLFVALAAPILARHDPTQHHRRERLLPPVWMEGSNPAYILGTDQLGRDIYSRVLVGSRISVIIGVSAVLVSGTAGAAMGLIAGFYGRRIDTVISRFIDIFLSIPFIILVLSVIGVLGPSLLTIILVLGFTGWASYARVVRGETLSIREREYVLAARVIGSSDLRIAFREILPNTFASIIVLATLNVSSTILAESALSYLGLGVQPPTVTWGLMIADGREYLASAWWMAVFPGLAISYTVLGIIFLGDWLRDVMDPKLRD
ncbi:MAG TPA: peptide ABC transporter permease [Chloroflexi bacterium]|nr:peptide ABC transporter permease [Chloroflexota bacterium]